VAHADGTSSRKPAVAQYSPGKWKTWNDVPVGERNTLENLTNVWQQSTGYKVPLSSKDLLAIANAGITSQHDMGQFMEGYQGGKFDKVLNTMPWAKYGLDKDSYAAMSTTFETTYKKITGATISESALQQAFANPKDLSGGLLDSSQYAQQLMNDTAIQSTYGWVKYGMDYATWTQQKLSLGTSFGRTINDSEAATLLQYNKAATGSTATAVARTAASTTGPPAGAGVGQSATR
jgi:hypothetical protein